MDRILPPDPKGPAVVYATASRRPPSRTHGMVVGACTLVAMSLAFAVGTPWLLREAPPDTYTVVATRAACTAAADISTQCALQPVATP